MDAQANRVGYIAGNMAQIALQQGFPQAGKTQLPPYLVLNVAAPMVVNDRLFYLPPVTGAPKGITIPTNPFDPTHPDQITVVVRADLVVLHDTTYPTSPEISFKPICTQGIFHGLAQPYNAYYLLTVKKDFSAPPKIQ